MGRRNGLADLLSLIFSHVFRSASALTGGGVRVGRAGRTGPVPCTVNNGGVDYFGNNVFI